jgi:MFS family permease
MTKPPKIVCIGAGSAVFGVILIGQAIAQLAGGLIADWAHRRSPTRGRIVVSQISILNGVWMTAFIFSVPLGFVPLILAGLVTGSMIGWAGKGGRDPILQSVLRPELRSTAWAMIAAVEGGLSALSAFLAGWLAEAYGLQTAMLVCVPASWFVLFLCWFGYYATYPRDEAQLRAAMADRRQQITRSE